MVCAYITFRFKILKARYFWVRSNRTTPKGLADYILRPKHSSFPRRLSTQRLLQTLSVPFLDLSTVGSRLTVKGKPKFWAIAPQKSPNYLLDRRCKGDKGSSKEGVKKFLKGWKVDKFDATWGNQKFSDVFSILYNLFEILW